MQTPSTAYSSGQFDDNYPPGMERHYWVRARNLVIARRLREFCSERDRILDIGCGGGVVVDHLLRAGFACRGVELGTPEIHLPCREAIRTGISVSELDRTVREETTIGLLLDVLEHLPSPETLLREVRQSLPNLRHLLITVPARQEIWSNYDVHFGHHRRYSRKELRVLLEHEGLRVRRAGYFFHALYLPMLTSRVLGCQRTTSNTAPSPEWLHAFVAALLVLDERLLPDWLIGSSLVAHVALP